MCGRKPDSGWQPHEIQLLFLQRTAALSSEYTIKGKRKKLTYIYYLLNVTIRIKTF